MEAGATDCEDPARDGVYGIEEEFRVSVVDTDCFDEKWEILSYVC